MSKEGLLADKEYLKEIEVQQVKIWRKIREVERRTFAECDLISIVAKSKNDDDLSLLMEKFTEWVGSAKSDSAKKSYTELLKAILRIHSYCYNIETTVAHAISMAKTSEEIMNNTSSDFAKQRLMKVKEVELLNKRIKELEEEIKFISK